MADDSIAVIIAAYNAEQTISTAVSSALASPKVSEVVVVDDASTDGTADAAQRAAGHDQRVTVLVQSENQGPSAARNRAIRESRAPLIAILDADDHLLPDRFEQLLLSNDWDLIADNLVLYDDSSRIGPFLDGLGQSVDWQRHLLFEDFVNGNIPQRGMRRGELGFLKPVLRRGFLDQHNLSYRQDCRLGEDFLLYTEALAQGARFKVIGSPGYASLVRSNSLSSLHDPGDLRALHDAVQMLLSTLDLTPVQAATLQRFGRNTKRRFVYRDVLHTRRTRGAFSGALAALRQPTSLIDRGLDWMSKSAPRPADLPRLLLDPAEFGPSTPS